MIGMRYIFGFQHEMANGVAIGETRICFSVLFGSILSSGRSAISTTCFHLSCLEN